MSSHPIAVVAGDGIGQEVVPPALDVLDRVGELYGFTFDWRWFEWGCEYYQAHGQMMPPDGLNQLAACEQIFLGAIGAPGVPDHVSLWGLLIPIRRAFRQYINLRPIKLLRGVDSALRSVEADGIDFLVVRENNEGEYSEIGGRMYRGTPAEIAVQESVFTRVGVERAMRYAFDRAMERKKILSSATKSNGIIHTMPFWDEIRAEVGAEYPDVQATDYHIDALAATFVLKPERLDVVVASNLFGRYPH